MFDSWMQRVAIDVMREKTKEARPVQKNRAEKRYTMEAQNTKCNSPRLQPVKLATTIGQTLDAINPSKGYYKPLTKGKFYD